MSLMDDLDKVYEEYMEEEKNRIQVVSKMFKRLADFDVPMPCETEMPKQDHIKAEFDPDKAEYYFNALVNIAEQRKCSGYYGESDNWFEVSKAREALGLPEDIPEIDDADF